jgi:hypothetical protein
MSQRNFVRIAIRLCRAGQTLAHVIVAPGNSAAARARHKTVFRYCPIADNSAVANPAQVALP